MLERVELERQSRVCWFTRDMQKMLKKQLGTMDESDSDMV